MEDIYKRMFDKLSFENDAKLRRLYHFFYSGGSIHREFKRYGLIENVTPGVDNYRLREKGMEAKAIGSYDGYLEELRKGRRRPEWAFRFSLLSLIVSTLAFVVPNIKGCKPSKPTHVIIDSVKEVHKEVPPPKPPDSIPQKSSPDSAAPKEKKQ